MFLRLASAAMLLFVSVAAHADSVTFTISSPVQSVSAAGGTLSFYATASAPVSNTGLEYLNSISINSNPANNFFGDPSPFFSNFPFYLAAGDSYTDLLFTISVPANAASGTFASSVDLRGGATDSSTALLGTQNFTINVTPTAVAATPEPSSLLMLGTGLFALAGGIRRRLA